MLRELALVAALVTPVLASAQQNGAPDTPAEPAPLLTTIPVEPVFGTIRESTRGGESTDNFCTLNATKKLPWGATVVITRRAPCTSRYARFSATFYEVLYDGKRYLVEQGAVFLTKQAERALDSLEPQAVEANLPQWATESRLTTQVERKLATAALDATSRKGLAIFAARIFDVSEHTEGTGFDVTIYNSGKKTIKYVVFSVTGFNAVKDPVRDRVRNTTTLTLRGIGPIEPGETASYSKDYMWMTDVVQYFRIDRIKLEYVDGTSKVISDAKSIQIGAEHYERIVADRE